MSEPSREARVALDRAGLALVATGLLSLVTARAYLDQTAAAAPGLTLGFAALLGLSILASARVPPAWSRLAALVLTSGAYLWSATLGGVDVGLLLLAAALPLAYRATEGAYRLSLVAGFALWTPSLTLVGRGAPAAIPAALALASLVAFTLLLVAVLVRRGAPAERSGRTALGILAIALVSAVVERHAVVASTGIAPDDATVVVAVALLVVLGAARARPRLLQVAASGAALSVYALVGLALILGKGYHVDAVTSPHYAAELLLAGKDPYPEFRMDDSLARFGLPSGLATKLEDGTTLQSHNYPSGALLLAAPFVALGVGDLRWVYLAEVLLLALLVIARSRAVPPPLVAALVVGNLVLTRQYVLAGIDPTWALGVAVAWLFFDHRRLSPLALGLACASRQPAWFVAPFYLVAVWRSSGGREAARRAGIAVLAFALPNLPFLLATPEAWVTSVFAPIVLPLEPYGVGVVQLGLVGVLPLLSRGAYTLLAVAALAVLLLALWRRFGAVPNGALTFPNVPLFLGWRSLQNYFVFLPIFAILPEGDEPRGDGPG